LDQTTANTFTVAPVRNDVANIGQVLFYNTTSKEITYGNTISVAGNITGNYIFGNGSQLTGLPATYGNSNVITLLSAFGSNTITTTGNITAGNFIGNISITGNVQGTSANVTLVAGAYSTVIDNTGVATFPGNVATSGNFVGNGSTLSNVATQVKSSWTVTAGTNNYSFQVPANDTYQLWVRGNIPNGIIVYTATAAISNTNVPVLGVQYGWNYIAGGNLLLNTLPTQFVGTAGAISNAAPAVANTDVFTFSITNNSGANAVVSYGWTKIS